MGFFGANSADFERSKRVDRGRKDSRVILLLPYVKRVGKSMTLRDLYKNKLAPQVGLESTLKRTFNNMQVGG